MLAAGGDCAAALVVASKVRSRRPTYSSFDGTCCLRNLIPLFNVHSLWESRGVEVWRGGLGRAYLLPTLSFVGASLAPPCFRFHTPLIEPDVRICRIRLSKKTHAITEAIACDAVCNF